jgi:hypothetical protein
MGCNCGGQRASAKFNYLFTSPQGKTTTYKSEIEARAAQIRQSGGTYRQVPA